MNNAPPEYLTPPEAAKLLRVRIDKLRGWITRGELAASDVSDRPGGRPRYRIARDDLDDFLQRRRVRHLFSCSRPKHWPPLNVPMSS